MKVIAAREYIFSNIDIENKRKSTCESLWKAVQTHKKNVQTSQLL